MNKFNKPFNSYACKRNASEILHVFNLNGYFVELGADLVLFYVAYIFVPM